MNYSTLKELCMKLMDAYRIREEYETGGHTELNVQEHMAHIAALHDGLDKLRKQIETPVKKSDEVDPCYQRWADNYWRS